MIKSVIFKNTLANFGGIVWSGLIQLIFVPLYIKFLGVEAFGLIGFFLMLQTLLGVLDLGLSTSLNREIACRSANGNPQEIQDLVRTMEWVYWIVAIVIATGIILSAPWIAEFWINANGIPVQQVQNAVILMGVVIAVQWPFALYSGGLLGLQRQVLFNTIRVSMATIQAVGSVFILWFVSPTIEAYFLWVIVVVGMQTLITGVSLKSALPQSTLRAAFKSNLLHKCWRFAAGMTMISAVAIMLTQTDKILLSKLLPLEQFGYYILAGTMGIALVYLASPVSTALFPKMAELVAAKNEKDLIYLYHRGCQVISLLVFPAGILIVLFSKEILMLWVRDPSIVEKTHLLLSLVVLGYIMNTIVTLPYMLQLAYGWISLTLYSNIVAIIILVPMIFFLIPLFGAVGGAIAWVLLNAGYVFVYIPLMHRRLIRDEMWHWYLVDVGLPAVCCAVIAIIFRLLFGNTLTTIMGLVVAGIAFVTMFLVCAMVLPFSRELLHYRQNKGFG